MIRSENVSAAAIAAENEGRASEFVSVNLGQGAFQHKFPVLFVGFVEQTNKFAAGLGKFAELFT